MCTAKIQFLEFVQDSLLDKFYDWVQVWQIASIPYFTHCNKWLPNIPNSQNSHNSCSRTVFIKKDCLILVQVKRKSIQQIQSKRRPSSCLWHYRGTVCKDSKKLLQRKPYRSCKAISGIKHSNKLFARFVDTVQRKNQD